MLGRDPSCEVRLDSPMVSRHHCCVAESAGVILVRDLGSTNGTRVNGCEVTLGWLEAGDELSVAHLRFRLLCRAGAYPVGRVGFPRGMLDTALRTPNSGDAV
jgi:pSer/pThr/pTyr-binding forkhead associated (FHA) protein